MDEPTFVVGLSTSSLAGDSVWITVMGDTCEIKDNEGHLLAIVVSDDFRERGLTFFTKPHLDQQLAYMRHPKGKQIEAHVHREVIREVLKCCETLFVKSGKVRVDLYAVNGELTHQRILEGGDVIMLISGGHGFEVLEESEMIEVKQGPYMGKDHDKGKVSQQPYSLFDGHMEKIA